MKLLSFPIKMAPKMTSWYHQSTLCNHNIWQGTEANIMFFLCSFLATGDSYLTLSARFRVGISTIHNIVNETCLAIWNALSEEVMPIPDLDKWKKVEEGF